MKKYYGYIIIALCFSASVLFVHHNYALYERSIVKILHIELQETKDIMDMHQNKDQIFTQQIMGEVKNGEQKGQPVYLTNEYSTSGAYDQAYRVGHELFVSIDRHAGQSSPLTGTILDVKRDKYVVMVAWIFIFIAFVVGKKQGLFSIMSLVINALILYFALDVYVKNPHVSLLVICGICVILFTAFTLLLVNGFNEKTYTAIIATLLASFSSLLITYAVMKITSETGLRYEEMQFLTRPYKLVFMAGLFVGSLGAVMDVAITMSSSIFGLYEKDNTLSIQALHSSGLEVGKDIMGTMTGILFFAYASGSIPMLILYLKNSAPLAFTLSINLSLELARALAGGIGIVLTIPIGLYTAIYFVHRKRVRQ